MKKNNRKGSNPRRGSPRIPWDRLSAKFRIQMGVVVGSSVYGKGYYAGKQDARTEDLIAAGVLAAASLVIAGGVKVYRKARQVHATRLEQRMKNIDDGGNSEDSGQQ